MTTKTKIIIVSVSLATAFAAGRYSLPEKIRIETKTVEVEKKSDSKDTDAQKNTHKKTITKETIKPDGTKTVTTVVTDDSVASTKTIDKQVDLTNKDISSVSEKSHSSDKVTISALGGVSFNSSTPVFVYGASVSKPILGPITVGLWGLSNASFGASAGLSF